MLGFENEPLIQLRNRLSPSQMCFAEKVRDSALNTSGVWKRRIIGGR